MDMSIGMLDHYNVSTRKLKETVQFYEDVLGFKNGPRPAFDFPGAWLYSGSQPVLHLNDIAHTDRKQPADSGVIDHVAFGSRGFEATKKHLSGKAVPYRVNQVPAPAGRSFSAIPTMSRSNSISRPRTNSPLECLRLASATAAPRRAGIRPVPRIRFPC